MADSGNKLFFGNLEESPHEDDEPEEEGATSDSPVLTVVRRPQTSTRVSLLIEVLVKSIVSAYEPDPQIAASLYRKICRGLHGMSFIDESWSMAELEGARVQFAQVFFQLLNGGGLVRTPSSPLLLQGTYYTSQYKREFDEFEKIGGGAFGKVFRVKHKLDGTEYAVKKIPIYSEAIDSVKNYLSEVKTFAILDHSNIVQYKSAWLEPEVQVTSNPPWEQPNYTIPDNSDTEHVLLHGDRPTNSVRNGNSNGIFNFHVEFESVSVNSHDNSRGSLEAQTDQSKLTVPLSVHRDSSNNSLTNDKSDSNYSYIVFKHSSGDDSSTKRDTSNSASENSSPIEKALIPTHQNGVARSKIRWATLYIQMALCHGTLEQWLRHRNDTINADVAVMPSNAQGLRTKAIEQILIQILKGLEYIHSKGIVHHDIKPSNIFVSAESGSLLVQLGDFGLACPLQSAGHSFARGTPLYAAPEQLAKRCDPKSDLYSMGIVLFELLEEFGTDMERSKRISDLRGRKDPPVPPDFTLGNLVSALVRRYPEERPDASTLLQALESREVEALKKRLEEKDRELERLRALLQRHGVRDV